MFSNVRTIGFLRLLLVSALLFPGAFLVVVGALTYRAAFADAENEIVRTSEVAQEHASRVFDSVRLLSDQVNQTLSKLGNDAISASERSLHDQLAHLARDLPQIEAALIIDSRGHPLVSSANFPVDRSRDLSTRDYFEALKTSKAGVYLSQVHSRPTGEPYFGWGEARIGDDGQFLGVVLIAISPESLVQFYGTLVSENRGGADGRIVTLVREDGQILVRFPALPGVPALVPKSNPFFRAVELNPQSGVYLNRSVIDAGAPQRLFAYRKVPGQPVYVVAGRSTAPILAEWGRSLAAYSSAVVVIASVLVWVTSMTLRAAQREQQAATELRQQMLRREAVEEQLRQSQKMDAIGQLTGGIAHDFNNMLMIIRSSVDLMRRPQLTEERRNRFLEAISDTTDRAAKLTAQLLAFARRQTLKPETFDVVANLNSVLEMIRPLMGSRIAIEVYMPKAPLYVRADPGQLGTSVVNLAVNARDAMPEGGRLIVAVKEVGAIPATRSHPALTGDYAAVSITDTGQGIPPELIERVFEPFFTTKPVGEGTGLGLSQVVGFAKQSGGELTVESEVAKGAAFTLYLPRVRAPKRLADSEAGGSGSRRPLTARVLVVEDNAEISAIVQENLAVLGCKSVIATNARDALALLASEPSAFDLVFTDVMMPGMSGVELAAEIGLKYPDLPVLLTTGYSQALAAGASNGLDLLRKPYSVEDLERALRRVVRLKETTAREQPIV